MELPRSIKFHKTSVAVTVIIILVMVTTLVIGIFGAINYTSERDRLWKSLREELSVEGDQLATGLSLAVWNLDRGQIDKIVESIMKDRIIYGVKVWAAGKVHAWTRDPEWNSTKGDEDFSEDGLLVTNRDIMFSHEQIGTLRIFATSKFLEQDLRRTLGSTIFILVVLDATLILSLSVLLWRTVVVPLKSIERYAGQVSAGGAAAQQIGAAQFRGELENLRSSIESMVGQLKAEKKFTDTAINTMIGPLYVLDKQGRYVQWNKALTALLDVTDEEMIHLYGLQLIHPDDREYVSAEIAEVFEKGYAETEARVLVKGGREIRHFLVNGRRMVIEGTPYLVGSGVDITDRKRAEEALRESEKRFRHLFEGAVDALFVYDQQGRIVGVNTGACDSLGYTREELLQLSVPDVEVGLHPADLAALRKRVLSGQSVIVEGVHRRRDGSTFLVEVHVALFTTTERPLFFAAARDITERKRAEEELTQYRAHLEELVEVRTAELSEANKKLKELDLLKSMFIASMSHELRTPLNSIIGFTGMTLQGMSGELNDEQKDNLTRAYLSAKHLLSLITDVIDISKIEAGRIEAYPEGFVLREMVNDAIATIEPQLKDKELTIEVDVPPETNLTTDRKRLLQCLINFLGNAVKFTESGGVTIASWKADGQVFLSVSDTGIGIAQKDMHRLFEPFERLETHLRVKTGGTGLGLYLTKKLAIDVLRGDVSVTSLEGQGSTFTIRVPEDIRQAQKASIERSGGDIV